MLVVILLLKDYGTGSIVIHGSYIFLVILIRTAIFLGGFQDAKVMFCYFWIFSVRGYVKVILGQVRL